MEGDRQILFAGPQLLLRGVAFGETGGQRPPHILQTVRQFAEFAQHVFAELAVLPITDQRRRKIAPRQPQRRLPQGAQRCDQVALEENPDQQEGQQHLCGEDASQRGEVL